MGLFEQILARVEQMERIDRMKAERERRKNIMINNNHYIEDFNETYLDKNGKLRIKKI